VIPGRFALYVSLAASVIVGLWAASPSPSRALKIGLTALAVLAIAPNLRLGVWRLTPEQPSFFAAGTYRECLRAGENVLLLPPPFRSQGLLWQAQAGFRFDLADAGLNADAPLSLPERAIMLQLLDNDIPAHGTSAVLALARAQHVTAIVVDARNGDQWTSRLGRALRGTTVGGIVVYRLGAALPECGQA
jgi:hypothetical protein